MKILVTVTIKEFPATCKILENFAEVTYLEYPPYDDVLKIIDQFDGYIPNARTSIDENLLKKASNLKVISMPSMGINHIDVDACQKYNVKLHCLAYNRDFIRNIYSTSEYTLGLILSILKKYPSSSNSVLEKGNWQATNFRGFDLQGKTIGIIGFGNIGSQLNELLYGFHVKVLKNDPYIKQLDETYVDFDTIIKESDIITMHVPLTEETKGIMNKDVFNKMQNTYFINASRGEVVVDNDLITALKNKNIKAAALDVISDETPEGVNDHVLVKYARKNSNLLITPHCGGSSNDGLTQIFKYSANKLINELKKC